MSYTNINKSSDYFNTKLWTGNSGSQTISGYGFQPDFLWTKVRSHVDSHQLRDAVRGINKVVRSNTTGAEYTVTSAGTFNTDGFTTVGTDGGEFNYNTYTYASWGWKANGQGSSNTDGTINTTYTSANTTSGMSIIKYSGNGSAGATIGHGLGVAPKCVIIKRTDTTSNWIFGTGATGFTKFLYLNTTDAETTNSGTFNNTAPSSSVITLGSWNDVNNASGTYIAYAFAQKNGFSSMGSYVGNGSATDAPFIYTGFKPAFIILRGTNAENWLMLDNKRDPINVADDLILPNQNIAAFSATYLDMVSNGFKIRTSAVGGNASGQEYIFMAFASESLVSSNGVPAVAR